MDLDNQPTENQPADGENKQGMFDAPNRYSRPHAVEDYDDQLVFHGYQEFALSQAGLESRETNEYLITKAKILEDILTPYLLKRRSVMDLGANSGYFCFLALKNQAERALAVQIDKDYVCGMESARKKFNIEKLEILERNFEDITDHADIVVALSVIHWFFSCTAHFGSLDAVVKRLAELTNYALVIEWVDPEDPSIKFFDHIHWNPDLIQEPYSYDAFIKAMDRYFTKVQFIADASPTRKIFIAYKDKYQISYDAPFPQYPEGNLLSSLILTYEQGVPYWSQVYDCGDSMVKQATLDLASREGKILRLLGPGPFPRVIDIQEHETYSILKLSKIEGVSLDTVIDGLASTKADLLNYCYQLISILRLLKQAGITHRDIHPMNLLINAAHEIFLIDFGWAVTENYPCFTPNGLATAAKLPDGSYSDLFSMGQTMKRINGGKYADIDHVIDMVLNPHPELRINDVDLLETVLDLYSGRDEKSPESLTTMIKDFVGLFGRYGERIASLSTDLAETKQKYAAEKAEMAGRVESLDQQLGTANQEIGVLNEKLAAAYQETGMINEKLIAAYQETSLLNEKLIAAYQDVSTLNEQLITAYKEIETLNQNLGSAYEQINALNRQAADSAQHSAQQIAGLEHQLRITNQQVTDLSQRITDLSQQLSDANQQAAQLANEIAEIKSGRAYRLIQRVKKVRGR